MFASTGQGLLVGELVSVLAGSFYCVSNGPTRQAAVKSGGYLMSLCHLDPACQVSAENAPGRVFVALRRNCSTDAKTAPQGAVGVKAVGRNVGRPVARPPASPLVSDSFTVPLSAGSPLRADGAQLAVRPVASSLTLVTGPVTGLARGRRGSLCP